jgi:hypothetical protein
MITLCIALHLYAGPVQWGTPVYQAGETCNAVTRATAKRATDACAAQGAERCEWFQTNRTTITIERKQSIAP